MITGSVKSQVDTIWNAFWVKSADVVYEFFRIVGDRLAGIGSGAGLGVVGH
ncbi:hypothetical protein ACMXZU_01965 [Corynebacterium striatum]